MELKIDPQLIVPNYPKIPEDCHIIINNKNVQIHGLEESLVFTGANSIPLLIKILPELNGKTSVYDLLDTFKPIEKEHVLTIIKYLYYKGVFEKFDFSTEINGAGDNNSRYYARCIDVTRNSNNRFEVVDKIKKYSILLVINSELGKKVYNALQEPGFEKIKVVDTRNINLNKILYKNANLEDVLDPICHSESLKVVLAFDRNIPLFFEKINEYTYNKKLDLTISYLSDRSFVIGPTFIPDETGCYLCYRQRYEACSKDLDSLLLRDEFLNNPETKPFSHTTYNINHYVSMLVAEIVNLATFINYPQTVTSEMEYNFIFSKLTKSSYYKSPSCKICSKTVNESNFVFTEDEI